MERWLSEYPSTFITITGPPGSGKISLLNRVLNKEEKPSLIIDCSDIAKAKNDAGLIDALAGQTGTSGQRGTAWHPRRGRGGGGTGRRETGGRGKTD